MSDQSDTSVLGRPEEDWLSGPPADPAAADSPAASPPWSTRRTMAIRAGLVAAGVVVGGVVVTAATHHSSASAPTAATFPQGSGPVGFAGEQRLSGTLVSVGSSTVRIRTISALQAGDPVFVHAYPGGSGSRLTVERLFAGSDATGPQMGPGPDGQAAHR